MLVPTHEDRSSIPFEQPGIKACACNLSTRKMKVAITVSQFNLICEPQLLERDLVSNTRWAMSEK